MPLSIISYNILADSYIKPSFYPDIPARVLAPESRLPLLLRRIREHAADVMCLQEVEPRAFACIEAELGALGYAAHYAQKRAKPDGCATFVRQEIPVLDEQALYFQDGQAGESDSGHVALLLNVRGPGGRLGIANTHIKWDPPGKARAEQWGYRQASELLARMASTASPATPWVVCGDFNAVSDSDVIALFKAAGFVDAYRDHAQMFTCAPNRKAKRIDYVLHADSLISRPMALPAITDATLLPSAGEPSDHIAIGVRLEQAGS
jgi:mRNA deadenylase 3'-5' endonuclease subunit Ccr4